MPLYLRLFNGGGASGMEARRPEPLAAPFASRQPARALARGDARNSREAVIMERRGPNPHSGFGSVTDWRDEMTLPSVCGHAQKLQSPATTF